MDTLTINGKFWLPGYADEDQKIAGIFTFSTVSGGTLQLIGSFTSMHDLATNNVRDTKRIIGSNIGGNKVFTLDNCRQTALGNSQTFHVGTVIEGYEFERAEPVMCDGVRLDLTNLQRWINRSGIEYQAVVTRIG